MEEYAKGFMFYCLPCKHPYKPVIQAGTVMRICPICKDTTSQEVLRTEP